MDVIGDLWSNFVGDEESIVHVLLLNIFVHFITSTQSNIMSSRIVFSSDLHGNLNQYKQLISLAQGAKANALIIGGDLFLKGKSVEGVPLNTKNIESQKQYFTDNIIPIIQEFRDGHVYLTFGTLHINLYMLIY